MRAGGNRVRRRWRRRGRGACLERAVVALTHVELRGQVLEAQEAAVTSSHACHIITYKAHHPIHATRCVVKSTNPRKLAKSGVAHAHSHTSVP